MKESGAWLSAVPISSVGLRMDDSTVRIAVGLRLGTTQSGYTWSKLQEGRHYRHSALNDIVHRALTTAHIPSRLEPTGVSRVMENAHADGITLVPWKRGKLLVWEATCSDTIGPSYM